MPYKEQLQLFTRYHFSFFSTQNKLVYWRKWKPLPQAKPKNGTLSCCIYNSKKSLENFTPTEVEMQQLSDMEKKNKFLSNLDNVKY